MTFILIFYNIFIITSILNILDCSLDFQVTLAIVLSLAVVRYISMKLERNKTRNITQILTEINNAWLWMSFMYLFEIIFIYLLGLVIVIPFIVKLIIILSIPLFAIIGYYTAHHNYIRGYELYLNEKRDTYSKPVTIIHISDIHYGTMVREKFLKRIVGSVNKIASEKEKENVKAITVISGDMADGSAPIEEDSFMPLKDIKTPVIFAPGNHDYYPGIGNVKNALKNAGVIILDNGNIEYKDENINIIGLSFSFSEDEGHYELPIKNDKNNILIYHAPFYWQEFSKMGIELELSGHTHGGQFYPMIFMTKLMFKYNRGLFSKAIEHDGKTCMSYLSVTEGVGFFAVPIRLGTHSEIVVLNINRIKRE